MAESVRIFGVEEVRRDLAEMQQALANPQAILNVIGEMGVASIQKNFEAGGRPQKWAPLSSATLEAQYVNRKTGQQKARMTKSGRMTAGYQKFTSRKNILVRSGRLLRSITWKVSGSNVRIGTNLPYAAAHQFGVGPHTIRPVTKKALAWPGAAHPVKIVNHPGLRARPFLIIPAEDWPAIVEACRQAIQPGGAQ